MTKIPFRDRCSLACASQHIFSEAPCQSVSQISWLIFLAFFCVVFVCISVVSWPPRAEPQDLLGCFVVYSISRLVCFLYSSVCHDVHQASSNCLGDVHKANNNITPRTRMARLTITIIVIIYLIIATFTCVLLIVLVFHETSSVSHPFMRDHDHHCRRRCALMMRGLPCVVFRCSRVSSVVVGTAQ